MDKLSVHSIFAHRGILYKVITADGCQSCRAKDNKALCEELNNICSCTKVNREDNNGVVYMELLRDLSDITLGGYRNINDAKVTVTPSDGCEGCAFIKLCNHNNKYGDLYYAEIANYFGACSSINRNDGVSVIFKIEGDNPFIELDADKDKQCKDDTTTSFTGRDTSGVSEANASHATYSNDNVTVITPIVNDKGYNNIHISIPDGFVIDTEASDLSIGHIVFKSLYISYDDIVYNLYESHNVKDVRTEYDDAIHKLDNIAGYYNNKCKSESKDKYFYVIKYLTVADTYTIEMSRNAKFGIPAFNSRKDAQAVIDNPKLRSILDVIFKH